MSDVETSREEEAKRCEAREGTTERGVKAEDDRRRANKKRLINTAGRENGESLKRNLREGNDLHKAGKRRNANKWKRVM